MNAVETLGLGLCHLDAALGDDAQAGLFDHGIDRAGEVTLGCIRLDDGKGTLDSHEEVPVVGKGSVGAAYSGARPPGQAFRAALAQMLVGA